MPPLVPVAAVAAAVLLLVACALLVRALRRARGLLAGAPDALAVVDADGLIARVTPAAARLAGRPAAELAGRPALELAHPEDRAALARWLVDAATGPDAGPLVWRLARPDGAEAWVESAGSARLRDRRVRGIVVALRDVAERRAREAERARAAERRREEAQHDVVSGLATRGLLRERGAAELAAAAADGAPLAVLLVDLDGFDALCDALGHAAGDQLLRELGPRMREALPAGAVLARLGGDELGLLLPAGTTPERAQDVAATLAAVTRRALAFEGLTLDLAARVGIALFPAHGATLEALLGRADRAMYGARADRVPAAVYDPARHGDPREELGLAGDLRRALRDRALEVELQPVVALDGSGVAALEAVVRWPHPERGVLAPAVFVPVAEQTGLMRPLALFVLNRVLARCAALRRAGREVPVAVDLGVPNLLDAALPDDLDALLRKWGVPGRLLQLEVREDAIAADPRRAQRALVRFSTLGATITLDEFGTGRLPLAALRRLRVHRLKLDRAAVAGLGAGEGDEALVRAAVELARGLELGVVAEGVDGARTLALLQELGVGAVQGPHVAPSMLGDELEGWLAADAERAGARAAA